MLFEASSFKLQASSFKLQEDKLYLFPASLFTPPPPTLDLILTEQINHIDTYTSAILCEEVDSYHPAVCLLKGGAATSTALFVLRLIRCDRPYPCVVVRTGGVQNTDSHSKKNDRITQPRLTIRISSESLVIEIEMR